MTKLRKMSAQQAAKILPYGSPVYDARKAQAEIDELARILAWIIRAELDHKSIPIEAIRVAQVILAKHRGENNEQ